MRYELIAYWSKADNSFRIEGGKLKFGQAGVPEVTRAMNAGCFHLFSADC